MEKRTQGEDETETEGESQLFIAAFTTPSLAALLKDKAPAIASVTGRELITTLREGYALTIDPGAPYGVEIAPGLLDALRADIANNAL